MLALGKITFVFTMLLPLKLLAADISLVDFSAYGSGSSNCNMKILVINGTIRKGDANNLKNAINDLRLNHCKNNTTAGSIVRLDSIGGDVEESLTMGRILRQHMLSASVPKGARCHSACVFILAGGYSRTIFGEVGIHRPYFENLGAPTDPNKIRQIRATRLAMIKAFFEEMDVSLQLAEDMLSTPPEGIKILTQRELSAYRINQTDANVEESNISALAYVYGLSSAKYRQIHSEAFSRCHQSHGTSIRTQYCIVASLLSISEEEASNRWTTSRQCPLVNNDLNSYYECLRRAFLKR